MYVKCVIGSIERSSGTFRAIFQIECGCRDGRQTVGPMRADYDASILRPVRLNCVTRILRNHSIYAQWAILDGQRTLANDRAVGETFTLRLESFAANPQLASLYLGQSNEIDADLPLYHAPSSAGGKSR